MKDGIAARVRRLRAGLGPLWWHSSLMFVASRMGDLVNIYVGVFLVPSVVAPEGLGALLPTMQLAVLLGVPMTMLLGTARKYFTVFRARGEQGKAKQLLLHLLWIAGTLAAAIGVGFWLGRDFVALRLKLSGNATVWMVAAGGMLGCSLPVLRVAAEGLQRFGCSVLSALVAPLARLVAMLLLLRTFQVAGYLGASVASGVVTGAVLLVGLWPQWRPSVRAESYRTDLGDMGRYLGPFGLASLAATLQVTIEYWVIRQRLPIADSAGYYMPAMFGSMPLMVSSAIVPFFFSLISDRHERGEQSGRMLWQAAAATALVGAVITVLLAFCGGWLLELRATWRQYSDYAPFAWRAAAVSTLTSFTACFVMHENACRRFGYLWWYLPVVAMEMLALYALLGWGFFYGRIPDGLWHVVNGLAPRNLYFVLGCMLTARIVLAGAMLWRARPVPAAPAAARKGPDPAGIQDVPPGGHRGGHDHAA